MLTGQQQQLQFREILQLRSITLNSLFLTTIKTR